MAAYEDLIPGPSPTRRSAYDDLLPGGAPAAAGQPAEGAVAPAAGEAAEPRVGMFDRIKAKLFELAPKPMVPMAPDGAPVDPVLAKVRKFSGIGGPDGVLEVVDAMAERRDAELGPPKKRFEVTQSVGPTKGKQYPFRESSLTERVAAVPEVVGAAVDEIAAKNKRFAGLVPLAIGEATGNTKLATAAREAIDVQDAALKDLRGKSAERRARLMLPGGEESTMLKAASALPGSAQQMSAFLLARGGLGLPFVAAQPDTVDSYKRFRDLGNDPVAAFVAAQGGAAAEVLPEKISWNLLTNIFKLPAGTSKAQFLKSLGAQQVGEQAEEQITNLANYAIDRSMGDPEATPAKLWEEMKDSAAVSAYLAPVFGGGSALARAVRQAIQRPGLVPAAETTAEMHLPDPGAVPAVLAGEAPVADVAPSQPAPAAPTQAPQPAPAANAGTYDDLVPSANVDPQMRAWLKAAYGYEDPADIPADERQTIDDAYKVWSAEQQQAPESNTPAVVGTGGAPAMAPAAEAGTAAPSVAPTTRGAKRKPPKVESIMQAIKRRGGIELREIRDLTGEGKAGKGRKGIPPGFFHNKGRTLDELANELRDDGFQIPDEKVDGGVATLREMINDEITGARKHYTFEHEQLVRDHELEEEREYLEEQERIEAAEREAIAFDLTEEDLESTPRNVVDTDLVTRAGEIDPDRLERAAQMHENDDAAFMAEVRAILDEADQNAEADGGGETSGRKAEEGQPAGFDLESQSEADLAARERAKQEAEQRRVAEEQAADSKRKADAQRGDFNLTGSDRTADANSNQKDIFGSASSRGMPAARGVTATATAGAAAASTVPPTATKVGKDQARPDAIRAAMRTLFGAPLNEKGLSKKYLGIYKIKPQTIRLQNRNDLRTASHEIGHHISELHRPFRKIMRQHMQELVSIAPQAYLSEAISKFGSIPAALKNGEMRRHLVEEGFAEFIAELLTSPATLQAKVPGFYQAFEGWLQQNPKYAQALQQVADMIGAHDALSPEDKILAKVGGFKPPFLERAASVISRDTWDTFAQSVLDKWHPAKTMVADLAPGVEASKNPYMALRLLAGDAAVIEDWINDFAAPYDFQKRLEPKNYGKPLKAILDPVMKEGEESVAKFKAYLIARRAAELKKVGKENLLTLDEIRAGLALETPVFKQTAKEVYAYNDRLLDYAVEGGLLSPEVATKFRQYVNYIPFFREPDSDQVKGDGRGNPFKKLTGGTANLRDPIANLIQNTANIIHATNRNSAIRKAADLAISVRGGGRWLEKVKAPQEAHEIATKRIIEQLQEQGVQVDTSMAEGMADIQTFFTPSGKGDDRTRTIVYKDGGDLKAVQVNDPLLWRALGNLPPLELNLIEKMLVLPAQTLRAGVVLDPTFMVRNFVRDTLSAMVQSKGAFIPGLSTANGIKLMAQQRDAYKLWRAFGGAFSDQFREPEEAAAILERMAKRGNFAPSSIITPTRWLDALRRAGSFTESGSRIGEFDATFKPGDFNSALQAAMNAREVSTDFSMRGGSHTVQLLTRITPFMNPAMQGLYKTARVLSGGDGRKAAGKAAMLGSAMALASVALALSNSDEEWYQKLEEWEKTTFWHFKLGDNVFRIPKPFEYGTLFASMPEAIALRTAGAEGNEDFKKRMLQALGQVFGFRMIPQAATIVAEPWANRSIFTGRKIVPDRQQHLEPGLQANPNTSKSAQVVGEAANVSPALIDNVVRNVFGTLGVHASTVGDLILEGTGVAPKSKERGWQTWPAIKAFVRDPDNPNSKQQRDFYDALDKYRKAVASVKEYQARGEDERAEAYSATKVDELQHAKNAEAAAKRLAKIRKSIRAIEWSRDLTPAEKREQIKDHNDEAQEIVAEQTRLYQAAKKSYSGRANEGAR